MGDPTTWTEPDTWRETVEPLVRSCATASLTLGARIIFDEEGSQDLAHLLTIMADELDRLEEAAETTSNFACRSNLS
jgi:hypothetical protein